MTNIITTTGFDVPGREIAEIIGLAQGNTVRARNVGRDILAGFKNIVGGEVGTYTKMTADARQEAYNRMMNRAVELGADAVIGVRFTTSDVAEGLAEMLAYGTAVKLR